MEELVKRAINGEELAFDEIIIKLQNYLYKTARMRLTCEDDINDAVQETIIQTYKNLKKIKHPEYFKTWIIKLLINNCNKIYNKRKREEKFVCDDNLANKDFFIQEDKAIDNIDFYMLIEKLNYKEKMTLVLYYLLEFTTKEISNILKEPESTIRNRIARARIKLKNIWEGGYTNGRNRI